MKSSVLTEAITDVNGVHHLGVDIQSVLVLTTSTLERKKCHGDTLASAGQLGNRTRCSGHTGADTATESHSPDSRRWSARIDAGDDVVVAVEDGAHDLAVAVAEQLGDRGANLRRRTSQTNSRGPICRRTTGRLPMTRLRFGTDGGPTACCSERVTEYHRDGRRGQRPAAGDSTARQEIERLAGYRLGIDTGSERAMALLFGIRIDTRDFTTRRYGTGRRGG
ncbi:hypothetical protein C8039_11450 [Halogeometricum sp. wsp3]|nr:hypothetical protein C8039_11450 [Halogeometricum sp. wsp3]